MEAMVLTMLIGTGATATVDLWAFLRKALFGTATPNYALVGRWFAHMPRGRLLHDSIAAAAPVRAERVVGWAAHYSTGVLFAALLLAFAGLDWIDAPTFWPALAFGVGTVAAPFLLMQPGMGAGIAAGRTPRPWTARAQSLVTHAVFGVGLYTFAWLAQLLRCYWYGL